MPELKRQPMLERLRGLSDVDLAEELNNERRKLFDLRRNATTRQLDNTAAVTVARKQIARIITLQAERARAAEKE